MNTALLIFTVIFVLIVTERFDKSVLALFGALLMILFGILDFEEAVHAIDFETIILLMSMMIIVEIARKSELFSILNVRIANFTKGNPLLIFILFVGLTTVMSALLDNVTTILIVVPITVSLLREMNINPRIFIISEIMASNIGGALTLIGDPPNILIGSAAKLSFNAFIVNLWIPILLSLIAVCSWITIRYWNTLKPISLNLKKLFLSTLLISKLNIDFGLKKINMGFVIGALSILLLTLIGFFAHSHIGLSPALVALAGALIMLIFLHKHISFSQKLAAVEWTTLMFFSGLFVMVAGVEKSGILLEASEFILRSAEGSYLFLLLLIVWVSGFISIIFNNIPFVTIMIPVIFQIQSGLPPDVDAELLWWALSLGVCLGGNGSILGASANLVGIDIAEREGVKITFWDYLKTALPLTLVTLLIVSLYFTILLA